MPSELAKAVCEVMTRCTFVPQTGKNSFHKYDYASDADLLRVLQPAMAEAGLVLIPHAVQVSTTQHSQDRKGKAQWRTDLVITYKLLHTSGEKETIQAPGCGVDGDDKGVYKAMTGALKYALRHLFLVPTGNNAEEARVRREQQRRERERPPPQQQRPAPQRGPQQPPGWLLDQLCSKDGGWSRETVVEDLRDFVTFAMPEGRAFDPWTASEERLRKLPKWLETEMEALEAWLTWRDDLLKCLDGHLQPADLSRWLLANGRTAPSRSCQADREELLEALQTAGQVETVQAWLVAEQAGGSA